MKLFFPEIIQHSHLKDNGPFYLPSILAFLFFVRKQPFGPEGRVLRGKSNCLVISGFGFFLVVFFNPHSAIGIPQFAGGPLGRPAGRPYIGISQAMGQERLARPAQETGCAS
jgi:hypothetical protein